MMAAPLYVHVTRFIPIVQVIRVAVRAGVLFLFAAGVLVAFGTDLLLEPGVDALRRFTAHARRFALGVAAFVLIAVIGSYLVKVVGVAGGGGGRGGVGFFLRRGVGLGGPLTSPHPRHF